MNQKNLSLWLRLIIIGMAVCGLGVYFYFLPVMGKSLAQAQPEFAGCYYPWLIFLWATALPCYAALFFCWKTAVQIGRDNAFSETNAKNLKIISQLAQADVCLFFIGNAVLLVINMSHPGVLLASLLIDFAGIAIAVAANALSCLIQNAAHIKAENAEII